MSKSKSSEKKVEQESKGSVKLEGYGTFTIGTASGSCFNCLIDSIGIALGKNPSKKDCEEIRKYLVSKGVTEFREFLTNDQNILTLILNP